ncbi:hypothetical protein RFI_09755, partial [Reticulomyxa filosa]
MKRDRRNCFECFKKTLEVYTFFPCIRAGVCHYLIFVSNCFFFPGTKTKYHCIGLMADDFEVLSVMSDDIADIQEDLGWQQDCVSPVQEEMNEEKSGGNGLRLTHHFLRNRKLTEKKNKTKQNTHLHGDKSSASEIYKNKTNKKKKTRKEEKEAPRREKKIMVLIGSLSKFEGLYKDSKNTKFLKGIFSNHKNIAQVLVTQKRKGWTATKKRDETVMYVFIVWKSGKELEKAWKEFHSRNKENQEKNAMNWKARVVLKTPTLVPTVSKKNKHQSQGKHKDSASATNNSNNGNNSNNATNNNNKNNNSNNNNNNNNNNSNNNNSNNNNNKMIMIGNINNNNNNNNNKVIMIGNNNNNDNNNDTLLSSEPPITNIGKPLASIAESNTILSEDVLAEMTPSPIPVNVKETQ